MTYSSYYQEKFRQYYYNAEVIGDIKQVNDEIATHHADYVLTASGDLYTLYNSAKRSYKSLENIKEFRVGGTGWGNTIFALTNDDLYGWGENASGEIGNESPHEVGEPYLILNDVKDYFLINSIGLDEAEPLIDDAYYFGTAVTNSGELYTWATQGSVEGISVIGSKNRVTLQLENVDNFQVIPTGIVATLYDGTSVNIGGVIEQEYWNDNRVKNRWDPNFTDVMVSLDATYYNGGIDNIYGEIRNNSNRTWQNVELTFALFDEQEQYIENTTSNTAQSISPGEVARFKIGEGGIYHIGAKRYELTNISPK